MGRMNNPRFSWMWQILISLTLLYSILSGKTLLFLVCIILSAARQYLKIDCLEIGLENKKWIVSDDNEQLDELMLQIQTNQVTGLEKSEGKPIVDAEEELNTRIEINIVGENESGPLRSAWISLSFAFIFYYLNSFSDSGNIWLFVLLISALCSYIIYKDRRNTNILRDVEPENGLIRKGWYFLLNKLKVNLLLISDGDVSGALLVSKPAYQVDIFFGIGGGLITVPFLYYIFGYYQKHLSLIHI